MASENAVMGLTQGLFLILLGQEQSRPGIFVVVQPDPEDVILIVEGPFHQIRQ